MSEDINALKSAITANSAAVGTVVTDVQAIIAKLNAAPNAPDFTDEVTALQSSASALQSADAAAQAVLNPAS